MICKMTFCPCFSGKSYEDCCEFVIKNESATTAFALMRSRYTAYCNQQAEYLYRTTHCKTRVNSSLIEIENWSKENRWTKLEIVKVEKGNESDTIGMVEFKAHFTDKGGTQQIHHEKSNFVKEGDSWFYVDGIVNPKKPITFRAISRNEPCFCGSCRKYKNCCG
ncbi:MAG TPA: YchJ family metal-binding protein [Draconibacterium sp.]|nr:YchJ family metal-binding protein [Draconibacterium sp.]